MGEYYRYWGKAAAQEDGALQYHLLPYHCLDVAAVANFWWDTSSSLRKQFSQVMQVNEEQAKAWVLFFVALHDLGKLDIRFQSKAPLVMQKLQPDITRFLKDTYYHGDSGYACFIVESELYGISFLTQDAASDWMQQVAGHHGVVPYNGDYLAPAFVDQIFIKRDQQARVDWINGLQRLFQVNLDEIPENVPPMLAGFCSVCDWIGSSEYFPYESQPDIELEDYLASRSEKARQALQAFGLLAELKSEATTFQSLFPLCSTDGKPYQPRGLQTLTDQLRSQQNLTLIEAPTGSGKTETALVYAANLLHQQLADSIIFALPTQATANAMLDRLEKMADNLFIDGGQVVLAHGKSQLKDSLERVLAHDKQTAQGQEEAAYQSVRWLTASKKRAFLGQIGVCTIDQVLLSVLPVKHKFVRSFGINKSVLIVDEVHAYDSYMYGLLEEVLRQQYHAGGSALLLSATLPQSQREALAQSWNAKIEPTKDYPLITQIYADKTSKSFLIEDKAQLPEPREVYLETWALADLHFSDDCLKEIAVKAEKHQAKVAIICNLVADAQDVSQRLRQLTGIEVDLFHSRYRFIDRHKKENLVKELYGKDKDKRAKGGRILVATQVVEQSLDLDFDWMITQLCPVDLLFQRLGRLHRHQRDDSERPAEFLKPCCVVIIPEQEVKYGDTQYVYPNIRALWRTHKLVEQNKSVIFPEAYRNWIEQVYQEKPWIDDSERITDKKYEKYQQEYFASKCTANAMVKQKVENPLPDESDKATTLTRDGEMSLTVLPIIEQGGKFYTLENQPLDVESKDYWERVSLNSVCVPCSWQSFLPKSQDGIIYLPMQLCAEGWMAESMGIKVFYTQELGLYKQNS